MFQTLWAFFLAHQVVVTAVITGWLGRTWNNAISSLEAPTEQSSESYCFWFRFLNKMSGNTKRAEATAVENSPNFIPAVTKHLNNSNQLGSSIK
jgi:hypothetical protein